MPEDVKIEVSGDVKKAEAAFDKLNSMVAKQGAEIDKLKSKTKSATDEGATGFQKMGSEIQSMATRAVGAAAIITGLQKGFAATIDKMKEIRDTKDQAKISTDESLRQVYKQFQLKTSDQQERMRNAIFGGAQSKGMKISDVAQNFLQQGLNGATASQLESQQYNQGLDLQKSTGIKDNKSIEDMIKTYNMREGIKNATPKDRQRAAEGLAQYGSEVGEYAMLSASISKSKKGDKISNDELYVLYDMMKDTKSGKEKQSASAIGTAVDKGGINAAIKATGRTNEEFYRAVEAQKNKTALKIGAEIDSQSVQAELNRAQNKSDMVYSLDRDSKTNKSQEIDIKSDQQSNNESYLTRVIDDINIRFMGAEKARESKEDFSKLINELSTWSASLSKETSSKAINQNEDKNKVHVKVNR